jgi:hypothetical protein
MSIGVSYGNKKANVASHIKSEKAPMLPLQNVARLIASRFSWPSKQSGQTYRSSDTRLKLVYVLQGEPTRQTLSFDHLGDEDTRRHVGQPIYVIDVLESGATFV